MEPEPTPALQPPDLTGEVAQPVRSNGRPPEDLKGMIDKYIQTRVEQMTAWYGDQARPQKHMHMACKLLAVLGGALVPVLINIQGTVLGMNASALATGFSLVVVVVVSLESVFQYGKQWRNYRSTNRILYQEKVYFQNRVGFYAEMDDAQAFKVFIERIEKAISLENQVTLDTLAKETNLNPQTAKAHSDTQAR
jgi:hypothetical protein